MDRCQFQEPTHLLSGHRASDTIVSTTPINYSVSKVGWAAGAGIEGRLGLSQWTWKVEYLHIDLGTIGPYSFGAVPSVTIDTRITDEIARIGFNYPLSN